MQPYGPVVLRVAVGAVFVAHGAQKLFGIWGGPGLTGTTRFLEQLGLSPAYPLAVTAGIGEFAGGLLLIAGALTFAASLVLAVDITAATWKVHLANGFFINWGLLPGRGQGYEFDLVLMAALITLMLTGAGALSVDERRARDAESLAYGRARLRAGKV
jgi:putative oxidoreductase